MIIAYLIRYNTGSQYSGLNGGYGVAKRGALSDMRVT